MRPFTAIKSCLDVTDQDIADALAPARSLIEPGPRERSLALVTHMASVAQRGRGAPKILLLLAHIATKDWLDGTLDVKLIGDDEVAVLEAFVNDGLSRVRLVGPLRIDAPLAEFTGALRTHGHLVLPLVVKGKLEPRRVELETSVAVRRTSMPPSFSAVSASLLPMVGGGHRPLPSILSQIPPSAEQEPLPPVSLPDVPGAFLDPLEEESELESERELPPRPRPKFRPLSLPPELRAALEPLKKK